MSEFRCWIESRDNPEMTDAEVALFNAKLAKLNTDTQNKINAKWNKEQGPKESW